MVIIFGMNGCHLHVLIGCQALVFMCGSSFTPRDGLLSLGLLSSHLIDEDMEALKSHVNSESLALGGLCRTRVHAGSFTQTGDWF